MSELINNAQKRKDLLKHLILQLHQGHAPEAVRTQVIRLMGQVPYEDVVQVEQELIADGMPQIEILKLCDLHTQALKGTIDHTQSKEAPAGHPVDTFRKENRALEWELASLGKLYSEIQQKPDDADATELFLKIRQHFNALLDVEKHYLRKENLLFPFLENHDITGPSTVMWGKHDEARELLKAAIEALEAVEQISVGEAKSVIDLVLKPASDAIEEMIYKEEEILFPMSLDSLAEAEWFEVYKQSPELGFCLYDPLTEWQPESITEKPATKEDKQRIQLPSGSMNVTELTAILNTIPFDLTFVDKDDTVRYFSQGKERIFARNRAILGRKVQRCHPPSSVHIVEKILADFRSGKEDHATFWIQMKGKFISIEYFALHDDNGEYLGTVEVSQDLTEKRALQGENRLLNFVEKE